MSDGLDKFVLARLVMSSGGLEQTQQGSGCLMERMGLAHGRLPLATWKGQSPGLDKAGMSNEKSWGQTGRYVR